MPEYFCAACGVQYAENGNVPARCEICEDGRQFVPADGQRWVAPQSLTRTHSNMFREVAPDLLAIATAPTFAIGQRALLVRTPAGNILWDCLSLLDPATIAIVRAMGGLAAIALSHPHFQGAMTAWARVFDCPIHIHGADRNWIVRSEDCLNFWDGEVLELLPDVTLHRLGGHFPGSCVLHRADRRSLLTGDTVMVGPDRQHVTFMWSFPGDVPLPAGVVAGIGARLSVLDYDSVHAAFWDRDIDRGAKAAVARSVDRYVRAVTGPEPLD